MSVNDAVPVAMEWEAAMLQWCIDFRRFDGGFDFCDFVALAITVLGCTAMMKGISPEPEHLSG